jgi:hypothetical protein
MIFNLTQKQRDFLSEYFRAKFEDIDKKYYYLFDPQYAGKMRGHIIFSIIDTEFRFFKNKPPIKKEDNRMFVIYAHYKLIHTENQTELTKENKIILDNRTFSVKKLKYEDNGNKQ